MKINIRFIVIVLFQFLFLYSGTPLFAAEIEVNPGDNLQNVINNAQGGDIIVVNGGSYAGTIHVQNRSFTQANPLIIKSGNGTPHITGTGAYNSGTTFRITNCSYLVLDGFKISNSLYGIYVTLSDHIIIKNCEVTNTGQEGIHARHNVEYLDILNCEIHHTGRRTDHEGWGEGIYIGGSSTDPISSYIYIANNEIYECGFGEGINIKPSEAEKVTIKNNHLHDIHPGKTTEPNSQWNGGAISTDQHATGIDRQIWIEENLIENIYNGQVSNTGIMVQQNGSRVINNTIINCTDRGIWFNDYDSTHPCWNYGNTFTNNGVEVYISPNAQVNTSNPGLSPYAAQSWYSDNATPPGVIINDHIALNKPVTVTAQQTNYQGSKAVDGSRNDEDRWSAEFFPQSIEIDLLNTYDLSSIDVYPLNNRAYQYIVEAKVDGGNYTTVINRSNNTTGSSVISDALNNVAADNLRITFTGSSGYIGDWISIREIEVFGTETGGPSTLHIETEEDIFIDNFNRGVILKAPNGNCYRMKVNNTGQFYSELVDCPQ